MRGVVVTMAVLGVASVVVAPAQAQQPAPVPSTITAVGTAQVKPTPRDRNDDASIRKAVDEAAAKALPLAVADARAHAGELAGAASLTLGALLSISDTPAVGYPFLYAPQNGTFGNGRFCGQVGNARTVVRKDGSRRRVSLKGTHKVCRVPNTISASVSLTYAVAA